MKQSQRSDSMRSLIEGCLPTGRLSRSQFWGRVLLATLAFYALFSLIEVVIGAGSPVTLILYPPYFWFMFITGARRYHDMDKSAWWLLLAAIPLIGPIWVTIDLGFRKGVAGSNRHGPDSTLRPDYMTVG